MVAVMCLGVMLEGDACVESRHPLCQGCSLGSRSGEDAMVSEKSHLILCIKAAVSINRGRKMLLKRFVWEIRKQLLCLNVETKLIKRKIRGNGCVLYQ